MALGLAVLGRFLRVGLVAAAAGGAGCARGLVCAYRPALGGPAAGVGGRTDRARRRRAADWPALRLARPRAPHRDRHVGCRADCRLVDGGCAAPSGGVAGELADRAWRCPGGVRLCACTDRPDAACAGRADARGCPARRRNAAHLDATGAGARVGCTGNVRAAARRPGWWRCRSRSTLRASPRLSVIALGRLPRLGFAPVDAAALSPLLAVWLLPRAEERLRRIGRAAPLAGGLLAGVIAVGCVWVVRQLLRH